MSGALAIRPAGPGDAQRLSELARRAKAYWGYSREFMAGCRDELSYSAADITAPGNHYELAIADDDIVGFYALEDQRGDEIELGAMFVEPARIGSGVGRRLMQRAVAQAGRLGARRMRIVADPHAVSFYQAAGAKRQGECPSASIPGRMLPLLYLEIPPDHVNREATQ